MKFLNYNKININKLIIVLFIFSLILRIGFGLYTYQTQGTSGFCDDWDYISYAKNINKQGIAVTDLSTFFSNSALVGPGYPLVLAAMFKIFGESYLPGIILNAILSSLIPIIIFFLAQRIYNRRVAVFSFLWSLVYILHIRYIPRLIKSEFVYLLLPLILYLIIQDSVRKKITFKFLIAPTVFTYLIHVDERYFFYFPFLALSYLFLYNNSFKLNIKKVFVFSVVVVILMIPWTIRNYKVYHKLVILTTRTSNFTDKLFGYDNNSEFATSMYTNLELNSSAIDSIEAGDTLDYISLSTQKVIKSGLNDGIYPHNYSLLEKWFYNFRAFWEPVRFSGYYSGSGYVYRGPWSLKHNVSEGLTFGLLLPFFLIGGFLTFKRKNYYGIFLLAIIFIHTFLHVVLTYVVPRYRIPIDAFVIIIAFYGLNEVLERFFKKKEIVGNED